MGWDEIMIGILIFNWFLKICIIARFINAENIGKSVCPLMPIDKKYSLVANTALKMS
jgi:hypothetical protein